MLPNLVAQPIAEYGLVRFGLSHLLENQHENIHYYSLHNLSGALVSIIVGAAVYFLVVRIMILRGVFVKNKEGGYRDVFPSWLNLEKYVYRAVLYTAVSFVIGDNFENFGQFCGYLGCFA